MTRTLTDLSPAERMRVVDEVHREAERSGWAGLSNQRKASLYHAWEARYDLSHATLKDGIMKGFDARQAIPRHNEREIQSEVLQVLGMHGVHAESQAAMWSGKERADVLLGFSPACPTHVVEIERADSWADGLRQVLWYRAAIFDALRRHVQPVLLLFGNTTVERFVQIESTCDNNHIALITHRLVVDGAPETANSLSSWLNGGAIAGESQVLRPSAPG